MYIDNEVIDNRSYIIMLLNNSQDINKIQENDTDLSNKHIYLSLYEALLKICEYIKNNLVYFDNYHICHNDIIDKNLEYILINYLSLLEDTLIYNKYENDYINIGLQIMINNTLCNIYIKWIVNIDYNLFRKINQNITNANMITETPPPI